MRDEYETDELDDLLLPPLRLALAGRDTRDASAADSPKIQSVDVSIESEEVGAETLHSRVPASRTAVFSVMVGGERKILATSTRYRESALVDFASDYSWQHVTTAGGPQNPDYKQILFRRV